MKSVPLDTSLTLVLRSPSPETLWDLRADLLALSDPLPPEGRGAADWSLEVVRRFNDYLTELVSKTTAHEYSQLASRLDMGSVGLLAVQDLVTDRERLFKKLFLGGLSESLMVLAAQQYVKAWQKEASLVHDAATWWLYESLWRLSRELRPELPPEERQKPIDALLAPARAADTPPTLRAGVLVHLFQVVLVGSLTWTAPLLKKSTAAYEALPRTQG
jgi:hypothetical protein